jgi:hypothetical protein
MIVISAPGYGYEQRRMDDIERYLELHCILRRIKSQFFWDPAVDLAGLAQPYVRSRTPRERDGIIVPQLPLQNSASVWWGSKMRAYPVSDEEMYSVHPFWCELGLAAGSGA